MLEMITIETALCHNSQNFSKIIFSELEACNRFTVSQVQIPQK